MAQQYDYQPGLDVSGLPQVEKQEFIQAIAQISPLSNIGGVIYQAATTADNELIPGVNGAPDVPNNARFVRYLWLNNFTDPPTRYTYRASGGGRWVYETIANSSIHSGKLATNANSVAILHMLNNAGGIVPTDGTLASKVGVMDAAGQYFTFLTRADFMSGFTLATAAISNAGGSSTLSFLRYNGGTPAWAAFDPSADITNGTLPLAKLTAGTANYLLRAGALGVPEYVNRDDSAGNWLPAGTTSVGIPISKLKFSNTLFATIRTNSAGTGLEQVVDVDYFNSGVLPITGFTAGTVTQVAHSIGGTPHFVAVLVSYTSPGVLGWTANNYVNPNTVFPTGTAFPALTWSAGTQFVNVLLRPAAVNFDLMGNNGALAATNVTAANLSATYGMELTVIAARYNR